MNLNFVKHHEIFLRQDIKSNYRNTAGTICPIYSLTRTNLELPKRQNVKHKSIKSTIFEIRLYSKIVQLSRVKLFINNPKTIEKSSKYIQSFYAEKFISKRGSPPRTPIFFLSAKSTGDIKFLVLSDPLNTILQKKWVVTWILSWELRFEIA